MTFNKPALDSSPPNFIRLEKIKSTHRESSLCPQPSPHHPPPFPVRLCVPLLQLRLMCFGMTSPLTTSPTQESTTLLPLREFYTTCLSSKVENNSSEGEEAYHGEVYCALSSPGTYSAMMVTLYSASRRRRAVWRPVMPALERRKMVNTAAFGSTGRRLKMWKITLELLRA